MKALKALVIGLTLLCPASSMAQDFPNKPIRLIVPFPPGGPNDIIARVVGQRMSEILKQSIIIENRSGQGGVAGTDAALRIDNFSGGTVSGGGTPELVMAESFQAIPFM